MDSKMKGAWLLAQSKSLDAVTGAGAARLENIAYAGKIGRLYNLLRRNLPDDPNPTIPASTVVKACQLNGIDRASREAGLHVLKDAGRIDVGQNGEVSVLGISGMAVLELTAEIFDECNPTRDEKAVLELSEKVAERPLARADAETFVSDTFEISSGDTKSEIDDCKSATLIDEEADKSRVILFKFRDGHYAKKTYRLLQTLTAQDASLLSEVQSKLAANGALYDAAVQTILGDELYRRLISGGFFDRMEISNSSESVGYICSPNDFQKYGRPFVDDPIDDAKALIASLTYGQTRSAYERGNITMPAALLRALIDGREVGKNGVAAIGEDYKELEVRQVIKVTSRSPGRYTMKLLKKDVGELALTIVKGGAAAQQALLLDGSPATSFTGPHIVRTRLRRRNTIADKGFVTNALDRLRSGG
jgi:hypothetical protein